MNNLKPIVFVKVPKNTSMDLSMLYWRAHYETKSFSENNDKNYYYLGNKHPKSRCKDFDLRKFDNFVQSVLPDFVLPNYDIYILELEYACSWISISTTYDPIYTSDEAKFYLRKNFLSNYFLIDLPQNFKYGKYEIKPLDKNDILAKTYETLKKSRNNRILFFILGIIALASLVTFCTLGFGFALIAIKIAITFIVLSAIAATASFLISGLFRKKLQNAKEWPVLEQSDSSYKNTDDSRNNGSTPTYTQQNPQNSYPYIPQNPYAQPNIQNFYPFYQQQNIPQSPYEQQNIQNPYPYVQQNTQNFYYQQPNIPQRTNQNESNISDDSVLNNYFF